MTHRLEIVLSLINPFDYEAFKEACIRADKPILDLNEYGQKVGWLMLALTRYPDKEPMEAYLALIAEKDAPKPVAERQTQSPAPQQQPPKAGCGKCGGGQTR